jgi:hypothetical protein
VTPFIRPSQVEHLGVTRSTTSSTTCGAQSPAVEDTQRQNLCRWRSAEQQSDCLTTT